MYLNIGILTKNKARHRRASRSASSEEILRDRECELSQQRQRLRNLKRKVCDAYERRELNKRKQNKSSSKRIDSPKPGPSNLSYTNKRTTGDRS